MNDVIGNTPEAPPAPPVIPVGLGTKLGTLGTALLAVVAAGTAVLNGDHTIETITALAGAVAVLVTTIEGRYRQAAAIYRSGGPVAVLDVVDRALGDQGDPTVPPALR